MSNADTEPEFSKPQIVITTKSPVHRPGPPSTSPSTTLRCLHCTQSTMEQPLTLKPVKPTPGPSVRAPSGSDLAPWSYDYIPAQKPPANLLIFLHGMGDTKASFANLARSMKWPETATISLQAPLP